MNKYFPWFRPRQHWTSSSALRALTNPKRSVYKYIRYMILTTVWISVTQCLLKKQPAWFYRLQKVLTPSDMQILCAYMAHHQAQCMFTESVLQALGGKHLNSRAHVGSPLLLQIHDFSCWCAVCLPYHVLTFAFFLSLFQVARGRARRDAHIRSIRSGSWRGSSFSAFTSTKRSVCSSHGCSIWQIARSKSGFRTGGWRRRNWTETVYSTSPQTPCFKNWTKTAKTVSGMQPCSPSSTPHNPILSGQNDEFFLMCQTS